MSRSMLAFCAALAIVASAVGAHATTLADYRVENQAWNGLSSLGVLAEHLGVGLIASDDVNLAALSSSDVLVLVHPTSPLPTESLRDWVHAGGRVIVADDFGSAAPLAAEFGLQRVAPPESGAALYGNPALALVTALGRHELSAGIVSVATNHPTALLGPGLAVLGWDTHTGLVYDMLLGSGRAVFVSDPSVFTNLMMPLRDNATLARNLIVALCPTPIESCRLVLVSGSGSIGGEIDAAGRPARALDARLEALRDLLQRSRENPLRREAAHLIAVLLALGASVLLSTVFPLRDRRQQRENESVGTTEFEASVRRFRGQLGERSWELPGAMLREVFEPIVCRGLGWEPGRDPGAAELQAAAAAWVQRYEPTLRGAARRARVRRIATELSRMYHMPRREALLVSAPLGVAERDVRRMYDTLREMVRTMGADDELRARLAAPD